MSKLISNWIDDSFTPGTAGLENPGFAFKAPSGLILSKAFKRPAPKKSPSPQPRSKTTPAQRKQRNNKIGFLGARARINWNKGKGLKKIVSSKKEGFQKVKDQLENLKNYIKSRKKNRNRPDKAKDTENRDKGRNNRKDDRDLEREPRITDREREQRRKERKDNRNRRKKERKDMAKARKEYKSKYKELLKKYGGDKDKADRAMGEYRRAVRAKYTKWGKEQATRRDYAEHYGRNMGTLRAGYEGWQMYKNGADIDTMQAFTYANLGEMGEINLNKKGRLEEYKDAVNRLNAQKYVYTTGTVISRTNMGFGASDDIKPTVVNGGENNDQENTETAEKTTEQWKADNFDRLLDVRNKRAKLDVKDFSYKIEASDFDEKKIEKLNKQGYYFFRKNTKNNSEEWISEDEMVWGENNDGKIQFRFNQKNDRQKLESAESAEDIIQLGYIMQDNSSWVPKEEYSAKEQEPQHLSEVRIVMTLKSDGTGTYYRQENNTQNPGNFVAKVNWEENNSDDHGERIKITFNEIISDISDKNGIVTRGVEHVINYSQADAEVWKDTKNNDGTETFVLILNNSGHDEYKGGQLLSEMEGEITDDEMKVIMGNDNYHLLTNTKDTEIHPKRIGQ